MVLLTWNYKEKDNPQEVRCRNRQEAQSFKKFVKRSSSLTPEDFTLKEVECDRP